MSDTSPLDAKIFKTIESDLPDQGVQVSGPIWMPEQEQDRRITELEKRVAELERNL